MGSGDHYVLVYLRNAPLVIVTVSGVLLVTLNALASATTIMVPHAAGVIVMLEMSADPTFTLLKSIPVMPLTYKLPCNVAVKSPEALTGVL